MNSILAMVIIGSVPFTAGADEQRDSLGYQNIEIEVVSTNAQSSAKLANDMAQLKLDIEAELSETIDSLFTGK